MSSSSSSSSSAESSSSNEKDSLRYTRDFPVIQRLIQLKTDGPRRGGEGEGEGEGEGGSQQMTTSMSEMGQRFGTVEEILHAVNLLLEVAIDKGQQDRIEQLETFQLQLLSLPEHCEAVLGRKVSLKEMELHFEVAIQDAIAQAQCQAAHADDDEEVAIGEDVEAEEEEECPICYDTFPPEDMRCLLACGKHRVCAECMDAHLSALINDVHTVSKLICPDPQCEAAPQEYEVEALVSPSTYQKYLDFVALESVKKEADAKWCPNKACAQPIIWDAKEKKVVCPACSTTFCFDCLKPWHEGKQCGEEEKEKEKEKQADDGAPMNEEESIKKWLEEKGTKVKPCPRCKYGVEKNEGCNHITCVQCQHQWCWLCRGDYTDYNRYPGGHFGEGSPCNEMQFDPADSLEEALINRGKSPEEVKVIVEQAESVRIQSEGDAEERRVIAERAVRERRRRRRRKYMRNAALGVALAPVVLVGGVVVVAVGVVAGPVLLVRSLVR